MSFEDDEYWESEYSDRPPVSYADNTAIARDRSAARRPAPADPLSPHRRPPESGKAWDDYDEPSAPDRGFAEPTAPDRGFAEPAAPDRGFAEPAAPDPAVDELAARR
jgi:hypothetical protein